MAVVKPKQFDTYFFGIVLLITVIGIFSFVSASLGVLAQSEAKFYGVLFGQIALGFVGGLVSTMVCHEDPVSFLAQQCAGDFRHHPCSDFGSLCPASGICPWRRAALDLHFPCLIPTGGNIEARLRDLFCGVAGLDPQERRRI